MFPYLFSLLLFFTTSAFAHTPPPPVEVDIYLTSTCQHCQDAHHFFSTYEKEHHDVAIHYHWINKNRNALKQFHTRLLKENNIDFSVPAFFFCGAHLTGFSKTIQEEILHDVALCQEQLSKHLSPIMLMKSLQEKNKLMGFFSYFQTLVPAPLFIPFLAVFDLLNACSLFFFMTFFIFIYLSGHDSHQKQAISRPRLSLNMGIASLIGMSFGLCMNLVIPTWRYTFPDSGVIRLLTLFPALLLISYIYAHFPRHPEHSEGSPIRWYNHLYYQLSVGFISSVCIYFYQQTCSPNFSTLFQMWTNTTHLTKFTYSLSIILYLLMYLLIPVGLLLLICAYQKNRKICFSATYIAALLFLSVESLILVIQPSILSSFGLSLGTLLISQLTGWGIAKKLNRSQP